MAFKMTGWSPFTQNEKEDTVTIDGKTYPKGYTEEDVEFLEEQKEDVVRYEDLSEKDKAIWRSQGKPVPNN